MGFADDVLNEIRGCPDEDFNGSKAEMARKLNVIGHSSFWIPDDVYSKKREAEASFFLFLSAKRTAEGTD